MAGAKSEHVSVHGSGMHDPDSEIFRAITVPGPQPSSRISVVVANGERGFRHSSITVMGFHVESASHELIACSFSPPSRLVLLVWGYGIANYELDGCTDFLETVILV